MPKTTKLVTPFTIHSEFSLDGVFPGNQANHLWFAHYSDCTDYEVEQQSSDWRGYLDGPGKDDDYCFSGSNEQQILNDLHELVKELGINPKSVYVQKDVTI